MKVTAKQPQPQGDPRSWIRRHSVLVAGAIGTALLGVFTDLVRRVVEDGVEALGAIVQWLGEPSGLPKGIATAAALLVVVALSVGTAVFARRYWPGRQPPQPSPARDFHGAIYHGRLWHWGYLAPGGHPTYAKPLCALDGAQLLGDPHFGNQPLRCPDCDQQVSITKEEYEKIAPLVERDIATGGWKERQEQFSAARMRLASQSKNVGGRVARAARKRQAQ